MASIAAAAALTEPECRALDRLVASLARELGDDLHAVWLYGSRARGEWREESDIDVLVIASSYEHGERISAMKTAAAEAEGLYDGWFSVLLYTPEWVADRRAVEAWFIKAVDRDKVALWGGEVEPPADFSPRGEDSPVRRRTQEYLDSASADLDEARAIVSIGSGRGAVRLAYNAAEAVLSEADRHVRSHAGRWHLVRELTVDAGLMPAELHTAVAALQERRERADYGPKRREDPFPVFTPEEGQAAVTAAERYLLAVEVLIGAR